MSYILDALKRADAERERGHIPGLHTRSAPTLDRPVTAPPRRWLPAALIGLSLLLAGALGLWWWQGVSRNASALVIPPEVAPAQPPAGAPPPQSTPATPDATLSTLPILAPEPPRPPRQTSAAPERPAEPEGPAAAAATIPAASTASTSAAPTAIATVNPVRSFAELTPDVRARLPAVNVSGSTYSQNPAHRMLIVNGKVVQEGGEISPGLKLETIEQRSAVLNHQGLRYRIGY
ncbi:general secretion pathway protein GspB [Hydrogenophaga sp.]|uniref:general secretion pathway protein GspB n=1 Tax=Hydrogenophaga sp. TaxID=1904254 RepID=UPI0025BB1764|nr:general secretion pathway protein GspB [Hydrogenophaga sp.]